MVDPWMITGVVASVVTGSVGAGTGIAALRINLRSARAGRDSVDSAVAGIEGDREHPSAAGTAPHRAITGGRTGLCEVELPLR